MPANQFALISPRDGFAGILDARQDVVTLVAPPAYQGQRFTAGNYSNRFPDTAVVEVRGPNEAVERLTELQCQSLALDFTLLLLDRELSQSTRREIAAELDELLTDGNRRYVLDIVLASPVPSETDFDGAERAAESCARVKQLIHTLKDVQNEVRLARDAWLAISTDPMVTKAGAERIRGAFLQCGVFRTLVESAKTKSAVEEIKASILMDQRLRKLCDARIVAKFLANYSSLLPVGIRLAAHTNATSASGLPDDQFEYTDRQSTARPTRGGSDVERERAESQVERIAALFTHGKDLNARQVLDQLVEHQAGGNHSHLVKSLCNIAKKCGVGGRRDIALECLKTALHYPSGIDTILYIQIGTALRGLGQFDNALVCYREALKLDDGSLADSIELEMARTAADQGKYEEAENAYLALPHLSYQPNALCSLGTLYRRIGNLSKARVRYNQAIGIDSDSHAAYAGLAEANRQSGRHDKAIRRYTAILADSNVDEQSRKIYSLAQSYLYRVTHQAQKAKSLLHTLFASYPHDPDVNLQFAKLYMFLGDRDSASRHLDSAKGPALDKAASQLFLSAIGRLSQNSVVRATDENVLPEDRGLENCRIAIAAIEHEDYPAASAILGSTRYVDRLQADFGAVLNFHARKRIDPNLYYKSDQQICRIAKRGHRELRSSVRSIIGGEFEAAKESERLMCYLIA